MKPVIFFHLFKFIKIASSKSMRILDLFSSTIKVVVEKDLSTSVDVAAICEVNLQKLALNITSSNCKFFEI